MRWSARRLPGLQLRLIIIALLVTILAYLSRGYEIDDALIYARYVANALRGDGLVFNANEHINALTSPLYSYLVLGLAKALKGHVLGATAVVSGVFFFGACALSESLVGFSGLLLASTGYFYTLVGMESSTFLCLLLLVVVLTVRERYVWLPTVLMLLVLTRFEGGAMLLVVAVECYRRRRWPPAGSFVPAVGIGLTYLLLNHHWYGRYLPASAGAKFGQGRSGYWGAWPFAFFHTAYQLKPDFLPTIYVVVLVTLLVIPGALVLRHSVAIRLVLPFLSILLAFYLLFNLPGYKWYYAPFVCFAIVYACAAIPDKTVWRSVAGVVILLSALSAAKSFVRGSEIPAGGGYPAVGKWLEKNTPGDVRVEAGEIGTVGWTCQRCYLMDILGLTSPKNAEHIAHKDSRSWLAEDQPDYVVVHRQPWVFEDVVKESRDYEAVPVDFGNIVYVLRRRSSSIK